MAIIACIGVGLVLAAAHALLITRKTVSTVMGGLMVCVMGALLGGLVGLVIFRVAADSIVSPPLLLAALIGAAVPLVIMTTIRQIFRPRPDNR